MGLPNFRFFVFVPDITNNANKSRVSFIVVLEKIGYNEHSDVWTCYRKLCETRNKQTDRRDV